MPAPAARGRERVGSGIHGVPSNAVASRCSRARVADRARPARTPRPMDEPPEIPAEVRELLDGPVDTVEKIEVLFLAWREPTTVWTVAATAARLRLPADAVATALAELDHGRLLVGDGPGYRYAPAAEPVRAAVTALCTMYDADRLLMLREMTALAMDRIRSSAARAFSDAFRIRRRDPGRGGTDA